MPGDWSWRLTVPGLEVGVGSVAKDLMLVLARVARNLMMLLARLPRS